MKTDNASTSKILFITQEYSSTSAGGAGVYAYELTKALAKSGAEVHVMAPSDSTSVKKLMPGLFVHWHKVIDKPLLKVPSHHIQVRLKSKRLINKFSITLIHSNNYAGVFSNKNSRPLISTVHHLATDEVKSGTAIQGLVGYIDVFFEQLCIRKSQIIICDSHLVYNLLQHTYSLPSSKLALLPCGIDLKQFKKMSSLGFRKKLGIKNNELIIFSPGGARAKRKGLLNFIKVLNDIMDHNFKIVVSGSSREIGWKKELRDAVETSGSAMRFTWAGEIDYNNLPVYYSAADIVVYPSTIEGFGLPALEALACAKPFIGTRTGEMPYIIKDGENGLLVDVNNPEQLKDALEKLINSKALRKKLERNARKSIADYSWDSLAKEVIKLHEQAIGIAK